MHFSGTEGEGIKTETWRKFNTILKAEKVWQTYKRIYGIVYNGNNKKIGSAYNVGDHIRFNHYQNKGR